MYKLAIAIIGAVALVSTPAFAGKSKQWNRGCEDAKRGYYDQDNHPQDYKDGNRACETAAAPADDGTPKDLKDLVNGPRVGGEVEDELKRRGYKNLHTDLSGDDVYSYWKKPKMKGCVVVHMDAQRAVASIAKADSSSAK
jgi:hypothetical protein